jgi:hypothetical protein
MNISKDRKRIYCHECFSQVTIDPCQYLQPEGTGDILCFCGAHLGYTWDLPEIFGIEDPSVEHIKMMGQQ